MIPDFSSEVFFRTARSGGSGGQHVNKVETMVEALWYPERSVFFSPEEKALILSRLAGRIYRDGCLAVRSQETRSQLSNKQAALARLQLLVAESLRPRLPRIATRVKPAAIQRRLDGKKQRGAQKRLRRRPSAGEE